MQISEQPFAADLRNSNPHIHLHEHVHRIAHKYSSSHSRHKLQAHTWFSGGRANLLPNTSCKSWACSRFIGTQAASFNLLIPMLARKHPVTTHTHEVWVCFFIVARPAAGMQASGREAILSGLEEGPGAGGGARGSITPNFVRSSIPTSLP